MKKAKLLLSIGSIGLLPIALSYGLAPHLSVPILFDIETVNSDLAHIFRAIMGLYLAIIIFWIWGVKNEKMTKPALYVLILFMFGLAGGRLISLFLDGIASPLLEAYMLIEFLFGFAGLYLLKKWNKQ